MFRKWITENIYLKRVPFAFCSLFIFFFFADTKAYQPKAPNVEGLRWTNRASPNTKQPKKVRQICPKFVRKRRKRRRMRKRSCPAVTELGVKTGKQSPEERSGQDQETRTQVKKYKYEKSHNTLVFYGEHSFRRKSLSRILV